MRIDTKNCLGDDLLVDNVSIANKFSYSMLTGGK
jgi:hypothetical protein